MSVCPLCRGRCQVPETASPNSAYIPCHRCDGTGEWTAPKPVMGAVPPGVIVTEVPPVVPPDACAEVKRQGEASIYEATPATMPGKIGQHPFLKAKLWEQCPACQGTRVTKVAAMVDGLHRAEGAKYSGPLPAGSPCPLCAPHGFVEVGLTVGQVERFRAERDALILLAKRVQVYFRHCGLEVIAGNNDTSTDVAAHCRETLSKCQPGFVSDVYSERHELLSFVVQLVDASGRKDSAAVRKLVGEMGEVMLRHADESAAILAALKG